MKKKHVVFDFDGTIFNSNHIVSDSWQAVFRHYTGKDGNLSDIYKSFGETLRYTAGRFFPEHDVDDTIRIYRAYQDAHYQGRIGLFNGVQEMMDQLRAEGHTLSVVTSRTKATTLNYLRCLELDHYFDALITCDDTKAHKPDPKPLQIALDELGAKPEEAIMLGDTKFDIGCCSNAGVDSILIEWSHEIDEEELQRLGFIPTYRAKTPADVLKLV